MGLFDFLKKSEPKERPETNDRDVARLGRVAAEKYAQNYDRMEAIEQLGKIASGQAARALLRRFDWSMEPGITDQEEKEAALRGIVAAGSAALQPVRDYCARAESLTWALRVLKQIVPPEDLANELLTLLDQFDTEYVRNPDPKVQLLRELMEHRGQEVRDAVEPFLEDASEPVRFQAATTLFALEDEGAVEALAQALVDDESLRLKNRIAQGFVDRSWQIPEPMVEAVREALPPEFTLKGRGLRRID